MNTVGKILVILNLLLAIAAGLLVVAGVALREPWKHKYEALEAENKVLRARDATNANVYPRIVSDYKQKTLENEQLAAKYKDDQKAWEDLEASYTVKIADRDIKLKDKDLVLLEAGKATARLAQEVGELKTTIKEREGDIVKLDGDGKKLRVELVSLEQVAAATQRRNEQLVEQVRELNGKVTRLEAGINPDSKFIRDPNAPNPPSVYVNGKVEQVDAKDTTLVQISLGTDQGVEKNHTLDVYRLRPEAKYLGMIRIVESYNHRSVGRLIATGNPALRPQLKLDDLVTSKITK